VTEEDELEGSEEKLEADKTDHKDDCLLMVVR
jgi:hypothetical protein